MWQSTMTQHAKKKILELKLWWIVHLEFSTTVVLSSKQSDINQARQLKEIES